MATHKNDPQHDTIPAAPSPVKPEQPSTKKPEDLDELADDGRALKTPDSKPDRRGARE